MIKKVTRYECENNPNFIVPIADDYMFHEVFGKQENIKNTTALISALLDIPYKELDGHVELRNSRMSNPKKKSKKGEKDIVVLVDIEAPLKVSIEMNKYDISQSIIDRNVLFQSDMYLYGLKRKDPYKNIRKTIQFNFNPRYVDNENKSVIDEYYYRNKYGHILTKKSEIVHINIVKMSEIWYNKKEKESSNINPLVILFSALICENEKDKFLKIVRDNLMDKEIGEQIERIVMDMNEDDELLSDYFDREELRKMELAAIARDRAQEATEKAHALGVREGISQGILQNKKEMIMNFYNNGVSLDIISKSSRLSLKKVEEIIRENKTKNK